MATPYERIRLVLSGTIATSQTWSFGITLGAEPGTFGAAANQANLDEWTQNRVVNYRDAFSTAATGGVALRSLLSQQTLVTGLTSYFLPANSDQSTVMSEAAFGAAIVGATSSPLPAQTCLVVSLRSTTPGRSGRGRVYLPGTGLALGADLRVATPAVGLVAVQMASLLNALNASQMGNVSVQAIVASTAGKRPITRLEVDNRPDTQRRRADKILATATGASAVTNA